MSITRLERTHGVTIAGDPITGYFQAQRNVVSPSYDGTGLIATNTFVSAAQGGVKGNRVKLLNTPYDGEYFIVQVVSNTRFVLNATFAVAAASGQIQFGEGVVSKSTHSTGITYTAPNTLTITGGNFQTNRVNHRDYVVVDSATPSSNNGVHEVSEVVSETQLNVFGSPFANGSGGNVQIQQRQGYLHILNETAPTWRAIADAIGSSFVIQRRLGTTGAGVDLRLFTLFGISVIVWESTSAASSWVSESEIVVQVSRINMQWHTSRSTQTNSLRLGNRGAGLLDVRLGSAWVNMGRLYQTGAAQIIGKGLYGSALFSDATDAGAATGITASFQGSTDDNLFTLFSNHGVELNQPTRDLAGVGIYTQTGPGFLVTATPTGSMRNINLGKTGATSTIAGSNPTIRGHGHGADTFKPIYTAFNGTVTVLDPQEDYPLADLFTAFLTNDRGFKDYTFNPRFVRFLPGTKASSPIQGANVRISQVNETTLAETLVGSFTSDANGRINSGNGVILRRGQMAPAGVTTTFRHRIRIAANGFDPRDFVVIMRERVDQDFALAPSDFRGEEEYGL